MTTTITTGGKCSLALCLVWVAGWIPLFCDLYDVPVSPIFLGIGLWSLIILSFPLGWLSPGLTSMGHTISHDELVCYLVLSGLNFFVLGYGLTGLWKLLRRLFSPFPATDPDPYSHAADRVNSNAEHVVGGNGG